MTIKVNDFLNWREKARLLFLQNISPEQIYWIDGKEEQLSLFAKEEIALPEINSQTTFAVPRPFIQLAEKVAYHRDSTKWNLLYQALWRIKHGEASLLNLRVDPLIHQLFRMAQAVGRDAHKMKAFVRFRVYEQDDIPKYIAWHRPDHRIVQLVAPFFQHRFGVMHWSILTPDESVSWDTKHLKFGPGVNEQQLKIEDTTEDLWLHYYQAIFNPARIKLNAMRKEMPRRHWNTLPETRMISKMLIDAPTRLQSMMQHTEGLKQSAADFLPKHETYEKLLSSALHCKGCSLYQCATQTVFGSGPIDAEIIFVGEQPGDKEDLKGIPFVGPAGKVLYQAIEAAQLDPKKIYFTNAVKHFKNELKQGRRIHVTPKVLEIKACKPWLEAELRLIKPKIIVCLGNIAAYSLIRPGFHMKQMHGQWLDYSSDQKIMATYHPSAVLRAFDDAQKQMIWSTLVNDLQSILNYTHHT